MRKDLSRFVRFAGVALVAGLSLGLSPSAAAQDTSLKPPAPTKEDTPPFIMPMLLTLLIAGGCIGANLIPSKRGHQD